MTLDPHSLLIKLLKIFFLILSNVFKEYFFTMNFVKNKQRNKMGDEYLNNCLVIFIEREFFGQVNDGDIINLF